MMKVFQKELLSTKKCFWLCIVCFFSFSNYLKVHFGSSKVPEILGAGGFCYCCLVIFLCVRVSFVLNKDVLICLLVMTKEK